MKTLIKFSAISRKFPDILWYHLQPTVQVKAEKFLHTKESKSRQNL